MSDYGRDTCKLCRKWADDCMCRAMDAHMCAEIEPETRAGCGHDCDCDCDSTEAHDAAAARSERDHRAGYDREKITAAPVECEEHEFDADEGYTCLNCGASGAEEMMAAAYDRAKDYRKYGDT